MTGSDPDSDGDASSDSHVDTDAEPDHGDLDRLVTTLHDRLAATATRPVREDASRWLGEAEAVAGDLAVGPLPDDEVVRTRLGHVERLLSNVGGTEDEAADEHVASARAALADALAALGDGDDGEGDG
ncbi:hypothetical protein [Haloferax sulfurifontis]|uniref:DUF8152 domain-containing protein n=1 Tax=Haloferax sulfurifontis TaxID=255616 RepID=A0A830EA63_9EURY|nr:hypothetical protein [Haloferax sulfurifontis]GGC70293.1 hypothetical protein GCM10007209_35360 [Haloferax sulfurifontis]